MRKLFKLKTILIIILLIISIFTQFSNVFGNEIESRLFEPNEHGCDDRVLPPFPSDFETESFYLLTLDDMYNTNGNSYVTDIKYYFSNQKFYVVLDNGNYFLKINNDGISKYASMRKFFNSTCSLTNTWNWSYGVGFGNGSATVLFNLGSDLNAAKEKINKHLFNFDILFEDGSLFVKKTDNGTSSNKGIYDIVLESKNNEFIEIGKKEKEYFEMGSISNYQYIHVTKSLETTKDEYLQFMFQGTFLGVDKTKIMNISIRMLDDDGNSSEVIPVDYSYSNDFGFKINHKISKAPINATKFELIVSLKDENVNGSYGHAFKEFDIVKDSNGESNSWLGGIFDGITKLPELIIDGLMKLPQMIIDGLASFFTLIIDGLVALGTFIVDGIVSFLQLIIDGIVALGTFIVDAIAAVGSFILDGLKALFIPKDDFFSKYFDDLYKFFSDKLGILIYPFELFFDVINNFLGIISGSGVIHIPELDLVGLKIPETNYNLKEGMTAVLGNKYTLYFAFVDCMIALGLVNLSKRKFDEVVNGGVIDDN